MWKALELQACLSSEYVLIYRVAQQYRHATWNASAASQLANRDCLYSGFPKWLYLSLNWVWSPVRASPPWTCRHPAPHFRCHPPRHPLKMLKVFDITFFYLNMSGQTFAWHIFCAIGYQVVILKLLKVKYLICGIQGSCICRKGRLAGNYCKIQIILNK